MILSSAMNGVSMILMYLVVFGGIIYFMTIRPSRKQEAAKKALHDSMKPGDSVLTTSGFCGVIIDIMDDTVIVEFGSNRNCRIPMTKDAISAVESPDFSRTAEEE